MASDKGFPTNLATHDWATVLNNHRQTDILLSDFTLKVDTQTQTPWYNRKDAKMDRSLSSTPITISCGQWMPLKYLLSHIQGTPGVSPWANPIPHLHQ